MWRFKHRLSKVIHTVNEKGAQTLLTRKDWECVERPTEAPTMDAPRVRDVEPVEVPEVETEDAFDDCEDGLYCRRCDARLSQYGEMCECVTPEEIAETEMLLRGELPEEKPKRKYTRKAKG